MKLVTEALQHEFVHAATLGAAGIVTIALFGFPMFMGLGI